MFIIILQKFWIDSIKKLSSCFKGFKIYYIKVLVNKECIVRLCINNTWQAATKVKYCNTTFLLQINKEQNVKSLLKIWNIRSRWPICHLSFKVLEAKRLCLKLWNSFKIRAYLYFIYIYIFFQVMSHFKIVPVEYSVNKETYVRKGAN